MNLSRRNIDGKQGFDRAGVFNHLSPREGYPVSDDVRFDSQQLAGRASNSCAKGAQAYVAQLLHLAKTACACALVVFTRCPGQATNFNRLI